LDKVIMLRSLRKPRPTLSNHRAKEEAEEKGGGGGGEKRRGEYLFLVVGNIDYTYNIDYT
jgi:hypothetical protein